MDRTFTRWDTLEERFWGRIEKTDTCWLWIGTLTEKGYGARMGHLGRFYYPHQFSYELHRGPIPEGLVIDHLCRVRSCVNPSHLEAVTAEENTRRGVESRWSEPCPNGHSPEFRSVQPGGKTRCSECEREGSRRYYEKHAARRREANRRRYIERQQTLDEAVVERILGGEKVSRPTKAERLEVVRRWQASGRSRTSLEDLTGWNIARDLRELSEAESGAA